MSKINLLSFEVANLIAAGEVVDRPASVLKELLENAIDSGATAITAEIRRGGVALIRVSDNGCGIDSADLPLAIKRHATSKISTAEDLDSILTLGFRGEALAAISSVSRLTMISKTREMPTAVMLVSDCGNVTEVCEVGANDGTTVLVEDLFANVPARRKFLKKDITEASAALAIAERVAMSRPDISFTFVSDGNTKFSTAGDGRLENALYAIFGRDFATRLIPVESSMNGQGITVRGFIGRSDNVRNSRNMQNVFINSRYIKSKTVIAALEQGFTSFIAPEKFPTCALFIEIDPHFVDVNVHPAKLEVKFSDEKKIFETVYYAVRSALSQSEYRAELELNEKKKPTALEKLIRSDIKSSAEQLTFTDTDIKTNIPPTLRPQSKPESDNLEILKKAPSDIGYYDKMKSADPQTCDVKTSLELLRAYKDEVKTDDITFSAPEWNEKERVDMPVQSIFAPQSDKENSHKTENESISGISFDVDFGNMGKSRPDGALASYAEIFNSLDIDEKQNTTVEAPPATTVLEKKYRIIGEAFFCYVMVEEGSDLIIIDKHAAHERIIFEELLEQSEKYGALNSQPLLVPIEIPLDDFSCAMIEEYRDEFTFAGFTLEVASPKVMLTAIPDAVSPANAEELFSEMTDSILTGGAPSLTAAVKREKSLYQIACKAAIKGGRSYDSSHIEWLVRKVMSMPDITVCPHGRPIAMKMTKTELDRRFNRLK